MHRVETQWRRENQSQNLVALSCEKHFKTFWVLIPRSGENSWFSLRHCVSARE